MEPDFWKRRWSEGQISFHEKNPNALLEAHLARLGEGRRVLVPLCGKSEDMALLAAKGHEVVGVELVEDAARAFFEEHGLAPEVTDGPRLRRYHAERVTILVGDLFACTAEDTGPVDAFYDRAAIIALPADLRAKYVPHLRTLLRGQARGILVTLDYDQTKMDGPPFAVSEEEVRRLHDGAALEKLAPTSGRPASGPKLAAIGATEHVYGITLPA